MTNVVDLFPGERSPGGGGPEGPTMDERVTKLERAIEGINTQLARLPTIEAHMAKTSDIAEIKAQLALMAKATDVAEIKGQLSQMPKANDWASLRAEIAEIKGKVSAIPTTWQLVPLLLTTWTAGAAIVFALLRVSGKTP